MDFYSKTGIDVMQCREEQYDSASNMQPQTKGVACSSCYFERRS